MEHLQVVLSDVRGNQSAAGIQRSEEMAFCRWPFPESDNLSCCTVGVWKDQLMITSRL